MRDLAGHGLLYRVDARDDGPVRLFRADLDGLPIDEHGDHGHRSRHDGHHHGCGHDGHATMLVGALRQLHEARNDGGWTGTVYGLFQPAEETGEGAMLVLDDDAWKTYWDEHEKPARAYALHNLPGLDHATIGIRDGPMASASTGFTIRLTGATSHAAHPDAGRNPIPALAHLALLIGDLPRKASVEADGNVATLIQIEAGKRTFGTAAGAGLVRATIRSPKDDELDAMKRHLTEQAQRLADADDLTWETEDEEPFPATVNDAQGVAAIKAAASKAGLAIKELDAAMRWSEDFGHFSRFCPTGLAVLGVGKDHPELHRPDYDFPDDAIMAGVRYWTALAEVTSR